jgi:hypothetical protein
MGFWSLTIYNIDRTLVAITVMDYNASGVPYVQGHMAKFNPDKSLDLHLQSTQPVAGTAFQNWLPTPAGKGHIAFLRMYWRDQSILDKQWVPPPIVKTNKALSEGLWVDAVERAGEGDGLADVVEAADPGNGALDAHAEAAVGDAAVFAQVQVPLEGG